MIRKHKGSGKIEKVERFTDKESNKILRQKKRKRERRRENGRQREKEQKSEREREIVRGREVVREREKEMIEVRRKIIKGRRQSRMNYNNGVLLRMKALEETGKK